MWLWIQALPCCRQRLCQAEVPCRDASPHGLHGQDLVGKDGAVVINISFLGNGKSFKFS